VPRIWYSDRFLFNGYCANTKRHIETMRVLVNALEMDYFYSDDCLKRILRTENYEFVVEMLNRIDKENFEPSSKILSDHLTSTTNPQIIRLILTFDNPLPFSSTTGLLVKILSGRMSYCLFFFVFSHSF
jgi:hypothetical protein